MVIFLPPVHPPDMLISAQTEQHRGPGNNKQNTLAQESQLAGYRRRTQGKNDADWYLSYFVEQREPEGRKMQKSIVGYGRVFQDGPLENQQRDKHCPNKGKGDPKGGRHSTLQDKKKKICQGQP